MSCCGGSSDRSKGKLAPPKRRHRVSIVTANSQTGLATVKAIARQFQSRVIMRLAVRSKKKLVKLKEVQGLQGRGHEVTLGVDANNPDTLSEAFEGAERALIVPPNYEKNRAELVIAMVDAAVEAGVRHIVVISVYNLVADGVFRRQMSKIEDYIEGKDVSFTHLRCQLFMDNLFMFKKSIRDGKGYVGTFGDGAWAPVSVSDVGEVAARVLVEQGHEDQTYNLTGPEALTARQQATTLSDYMGYTIKYDDLSAAAYAKKLKKHLIPAWQIDGMMQMEAAIRDGRGSVVSEDVAKITGAHTSFVDWCRSNSAVFMGRFRFPEDEETVQRRIKERIARESEQAAKQREEEEKDKRKMDAEQSKPLVGGSDGENDEDSEGGEDDVAYETLKSPRADDEEEAKNETQTWDDVTG